MKEQQWAGKINRARYVERNVLNWIRKNFDPEAALIEQYSPEFDIISEVLGNVEVKEDRLAHQTENYAIEFEDGHGEPSGIAATEAKHFVIVDWEYVSLMATESLNYIIREEKRKRQILMGYKFDDGTKSKGWLIPRTAILSSPFAKVVKRWFPVLQENEVRQ